MITKSNCPILPKKLNNMTPIEEPTIPPSSKTVPILKSTLLLFQWDRTPETEGATNWLATEATATGGGTPNNSFILLNHDGNVRIAAGSSPGASEGITVLDGGNVSFSGNVSGSSTSTGSFGRIQASNIAGNSDINILDDVNFNNVTLTNLDADSGNIGGSKSNEFHVIANTGEDDLLIDKDGVGINFEIAKERYKTDNIEKICNENNLIHKKGIEVGHIFKLGDKYSKSMNLSIADSENNNHFLQMGCYGIGVSRIIAAAIEQNYDTNGIIWPKSISPFDAVIIEIDGDKNEEVRKYSESIYEMLINRNIDVILDDRNAKLGNKLMTGSW